MPRSNSPLSLSIQGAGASQRLEQALPVGEPIRIGRQPQVGWAIPWDRMISREHADLLWDGKRLTITVTPNAQNPVLFQSKPHREITVDPGDWFQIGQTTFQTRADEPEEVQSELDSTAAFRLDAGTGYSAAELRKVQFQHAAQQLEILAELPEGIRQSLTDEDLCATLSRLLLAALPQAEAVAVSHYDMSLLPPDPAKLDNFPKPLTMRTEMREEYSGRFRPSRRMIWQSLKYERSLIHISSGDDEPGSGGFTLSEGLGWSFCCPVRGEATKGWCLYVSGRGSRTGSMMITDADLAPDLRFTELVAQFIGSVRQVRLLQDQKTQLSTFFSPKVIESLSDSRNSTDLLSPAERAVSVLFCDVRGFSRKSEQLQGDLLTLLRSVSGALGVMAGSIQDNDGTIADFQGDAALGFWGWPVALEEGPLPACHAALQIYREFRDGGTVEGGLLEGFSVGLGICHGRALAGQIGTARQAKVGVFGPVVNQGSRLEGMTKQFGVPICIDEATAVYVRTGLPKEKGRLRRLARVRPKGMETSMTVFALLPSLEDFPEVTEGMLEQHEGAVDAIIDGHWDRALEILRTFPTTDGPSQHLLKLMAQHDNKVPHDWDGAFSLQSK